MKINKNTLQILAFDAVLILALTSALFAVTEISFRAYEYATFREKRLEEIENSARLVREWEAMSIPVDKRPNSEAYRDVVWAEDFVKEAKANPDPGLVYEPFSLWRHKPYKNKYVDYSENGYRVTVPGGTPNCLNPKKIFIFGGSTIAGDGIIRDEDTIPSLLAKQMSEQGFCVEVKNYGQSGFNQGNEAVLFMTLLASEETPDMAIFYDGANDATHRVAYGVPHMAYDYFSRVTDFNSSKPRLRQMIFEFLWTKLAVVRVLIPMEKTDVSKEKLEVDENIINKRGTEVAQSYVKKARLIDRLGKEYKVKTVFVLQPTLFQKNILTSDEKNLAEAVKKTAPTLKTSVETFYAGVRKGFKQDNPESPFVDLSDVFDRDSEALYVDYAHVSPKANQVIAQKLFGAIQKAALLQ
jgi:lysophospholipase L1-like esterase